MKRTRSTILILFFLLGSVSIATAQAISINTDRPDQSDGVATVPVHKFQLEEGLTLSEQTAINNLMIRYGITNSTEVRLLVDAGKQYESKGLQPITLSVKQKIIKQHDIVPAISFVGYLAYGRLATNDFSNREWSFQLKLAFENELSDRWALSYNVGTSNRFENLDLTLNLGYAPTAKISAFVEYFSTLNKISNEHNLDAGILYLITPLFQVDIAVGHSIFASSDRFFTTFGISYLFN